MSNIRTDDLLRTLPQVLKNDDMFCAFAAVAAKQLRGTVGNVDCATIYARIDALPEGLLDILAYDFKVDWWDYNYTIEQKRQTLKDSFLVHKHLGTKFAVRTAISAIYPNSTVEEWFEWGGEPYTFRLLINASNVVADIDRHFRVLELANYYKNLRSHLSSIDYVVEAEPEEIHLGIQVGGIYTLHVPELADELTYEDKVMLGLTGLTTTTLHIPCKNDAVLGMSLLGSMVLGSTSPDDPDGSKLGKALLGNMLLGG